MTKTTTLLALIAALGLLAGCNTIEGMGKDISKAGDKIEEAAKKKRGVATHQAEAEHVTAVAAAAGHMDRTVVAGLITGGVLIIGGVAAATFFYLRLLRKTSLV